MPSLAVRAPSDDACLTYCTFASAAVEGVMKCIVNDEELRGGPEAVNYFSGNTPAKGVCH